MKIDPEKSVQVFAPATVANVGSGFDVLGFAVNEPGDEVIARLTEKPGVYISRITGDSGKLPLDAEKNTAGVAISSFLKHMNFKQGVEIELHKKMPLGSGMGSSAASAVAGVYAANELLGNPLKKEELLPFALEGEKISTGSSSIHADNIAPCLLGGFILIRSYTPLDIVSIPFPKNLFCTLVHPHIVVRTEDARNILEKHVLLKDAITQWGNVAGLVAGLMKGDFELIGRSLKDVLIEPVRSMLIPGYDLVKAAAIDAGALGCGISGACPTMFALSTSHDTAENIGKMMEEAFQKVELDSNIYISRINQEGPKVLSLK